jgi:hypothetical protein
MRDIEHTAADKLGCRAREGEMREVASTLRMGAVLSGAVVAYSAAAFAEPVKDADLRGKKICWSNGAFTTYHKDGTFDCTICGHGRWRLDGDTLTESNGKDVLVLKIAKNGRTLHESSQYGPNGPLDLQGTYCK